MTARKLWKLGCFAVLACLRVVTSLAQSQPLPAEDVDALYRRLLPRIEQIRIWDNHGHPAYADDPDVDAMVAAPGMLPVRLRDDNPELVVAAKALFGYPYSDLSPQHAQWLVDTKAKLRRDQGRAYFGHILDQLGIEAAVANRVAMADYLDSARFRWVFFVDNFLFPFSTESLTAGNPDRAIYLPLQQKLLQRNMQHGGLAALPATLNEYLTFVDRIIEENRAGGAVGMKFEFAYFRPLHFSDPPASEAGQIYATYRSAGRTPTEGEYLRWQDYVFRHLLQTAAKLRLPVQIHSAVGPGEYFSLQQGDILNLEDVLRDPRYSGVNFVLVHGGYPRQGEAIWLAARKNVYLDSSLMGVYLYPAALKQTLRQWLTLFPEKVMFGSDAFPFNAALGAEESYWLAVHSARTALAAALAEMIAAREVTEAQALQLARAYLHDNAARLYATSK